MEKNRRSIYEFGNFELLLSAVKDIVPELKHYFLDHWPEIIAMSMIRAQDPKPTRYMKSCQRRSMHSSLKIQYWKN
ncbi:MAG: hypothetical protein LVQ96_03845 [Thermoplasmatales archaeon]|nr:hypothetical protein [Thermoplasmatales archaeon]MCW6170285.1 hypothetical protein [Thermoplasmatales archaeon]